MEHYAEEATSDGLGESLPQRFDVGLNYVAHGLDGGGNHDDPEKAQSRTNYFRETYAYGNEKRVDGVEPFLAHPKMQRAAARNLCLRRGCSGDCLCQSTDTGAGACDSHGTFLSFAEPIVRVHLNGCWFVCCIQVCLIAGASGYSPVYHGLVPPRGGAFTFYPSGSNGSRESIAAQNNSAILIDTDKVFHGGRASGPAITLIYPPLLLGLACIT